jgi:hypothetical protein
MRLHGEIGNAERRSFTGNTAPEWLGYLTYPMMLSTRKWHRVGIGCTIERFECRFSVIANGYTVDFFNPVS